MDKQKSHFVLLTVLAIAGCVGQIEDDQPEDMSDQPEDIAPTFGAAANPAALSDRESLPAAAEVDPGTSVIAAAAAPGMTYHGGPIMAGTVTLYYIFYGNWTHHVAEKNLAVQFAFELSGSSYFRTNTVYGDRSGRRVSGLLRFGGAVDDAYSHGRTWVHGSEIVAHNIDRFPYDPKGIYVVFTSPDVSAVQGSMTFPGTHCGWHYYIDNGPGEELKWALVGNTGGTVGKNCIAPALAAPHHPPNGTVAGDAMVSILAHELSETVTDPLINAWWQPVAGEVGDRCAWNFGTVHNYLGIVYNVTIGKHPYLIQQNYVGTNPAFGSYTKGHCSLGI